MFKVKGKLWKYSLFKEISCEGQRCFDKVCNSEFKS
jgi:hypothetical protein